MRNQAVDLMTIKRLVSKIESTKINTKAGQAKVDALFMAIAHVAADAANGK